MAGQWSDWGDQLHAARVAANKTLLQLEAESAFSHATWWRWEKGELLPHARQWGAILEVLPACPPPPYVRRSHSGTFTPLGDSWARTPLEDWGNRFRVARCAYAPLARVEYETHVSKITLLRLESGKDVPTPVQWERLTRVIPGLPQPPSFREGARKRTPGKRQRPAYNPAHDLVGGEQSTVLGAVRSTCKISARKMAALLGCGVQDYVAAEQSKAPIPRQWQVLLGVIVDRCAPGVAHRFTGW